MTFAHPSRLLLLVAIFAIAAAYAALQLTRRRYAVRFTNVELLDKIAPKRPGWRRHAVAICFLGVGAALVTAFAGPTHLTRTPRERATVVLVIDTSISMAATDVDPTRIEGARVAAMSFLDDVPDSINVGLVTFNGVATIQVTPTTDREPVRAALDRLELGERTGIGGSIVAALDAIESVPIQRNDDAEATPATIVVMSDGDSTSDVPELLGIPEALEAGVPVSTISFGTLNGLIEYELDPAIGPEPVPVPVREDDLRAIADETGGQFFRAGNTDELRSVYGDIGSAIGFIEERRDITEWFTGAALVIFVLTATLSLTWFSRLP